MKATIAIDYCILKYSWPNATLFMVNFEHGLYANGVFHHFLTNQENAEFHIVAGDEVGLFSLDPNSGRELPLSSIPFALFRRTFCAPFRTVAIQRYIHSPHYSCFQWPQSQTIHPSTIHAAFGAFGWSKETRLFSPKTIHCNAANW